MALPATHNKEPGGLIRAGTEQSDCVLEIRGRDERSSTTGPQRETTLERHQGPFVKSLQSQQSCWGILYTHTHTHWETLTFPTRAHTESHKRTFPNIYAQTISRQTTASNRPLPLSLPDSDSQAVINISVGVTGQSVSLEGHHRRRYIRRLHVHSLGTHRASHLVSREEDVSVSNVLVSVT